tara:strand:+ start:99 stop:629 length:531 start_codon:yes stop_codon:yes gene_type:complete
MAGYVATGQVKSVELKYDHKLSYQKHVNDVFLIVTYNDGQDWDKTLNVFGNFNKKNNTWGSALKLKMFFEAIGIKDPEYKDDWSIPDTYLDKAVGQEFLVLSYPSKNLKDNGKPYWNIFPEVMAVNRGMDRLKERFNKQVSEGWVKDLKVDDNSSHVTKETQTKEVPELNLAGIDI